MNEYFNKKEYNYFSKAFIMSWRNCHTHLQVCLTITLGLVLFTSVIRAKFIHVKIFLFKEFNPLLSQKFCITQYVVFWLVEQAGFPCEVRQYKFGQFLDFLSCFLTGFASALVRKLGRT